MLLIPLFIRSVIALTRVDKSFLSAAEMAPVRSTGRREAP